MELILSEEQMLVEWMRRRYHEPVERVDAAVTRHYGVDVESLARDEMRRWYVDLLDRGDVGCLCPQDYALDVRLNLCADRSYEVLLPEGTRRVVDVGMSCWSRSAVVYRGDELSREFRRRLSNPFSRPGGEMPVAVVEGRRMRLYSLPSAYDSGRLTSLSLVVDAGPGVYRFDDSALALIG